MLIEDMEADVRVFMETSDCWLSVVTVASFSTKFLLARKLSLTFGAIRFISL